MKSKIALFLCIVMIISCLASCQKAPEITDDGTIDFSENRSETISQETSDDNSEDDTTIIPDNISYYTGEYITAWWNAAPLENGSNALNEWYSTVNMCGINDLLLSGDPNLNKTTEYYYVGIKFIGTTDEINEKLAHKDDLLKSVGFIHVEDKYLQADYVANLFGWPFTEETVITEEEHSAKSYQHLKNLIPGVDLSEYEGIGTHLIECFNYHDTGYITLTGLEQLAEEHGKIAVTWLPAPDDRIRFLTTFKHSSYPNKPNHFNVMP